MNDPTKKSGLSQANRWLTPVEDLFNLVAAAGIFLLMVLGVLQIGLRSLLNIPIVGYIDLVELSMATMAFMGAAYCQRVGAHIRMEMLIGRLRGRWLWAAESLGVVVGLVVVGVLVVYSWDHFLRAYELGDTTIDAEFPVWPSKLLVPIAFSLWFLRLLVQLIGSLRLVINPDLAPEGVVVMKELAEQAQDELREAFLEDPTEHQNAVGPATSQARQ